MTAFGDQMGVVPSRRGIGGISDHRIRGIFSMYEDYKKLAEERNGLLKAICDEDLVGAHGK